jgi:hypothetical protein
MIGAGTLAWMSMPFAKRGIGRLVLLRGQGVQDGSIDSQRTHWRSSGGGAGGGGVEVDTSSGVGILIALGGDASEERASRSVIRVAVSARRTIASRQVE